MRRMISAVLLAIGISLWWGQAGTRPLAQELRVPANVQAILGSLSQALPVPGGSLRARVVSSPRYAVRVSGEEVTVTTAFLRGASSDALAAGVVYRLLPDPVYFVITMDRAGFDGPSGLAELNERLLYDAAIEYQYWAALDAAYTDMTEAVYLNSLWIVARPGSDVMYGQMDATTARYYDALAAYEAYRAERPDLPPITAEFIRTVTEITTVLRGGPAVVSPWQPRIAEALKAYPLPQEE